MRITSFNKKTFRTPVERDKACPDQYASESECYCIDILCAIYVCIFFKYFKQGFYYRIESIFILWRVSDWTNVFIVTWLSYAEEELEIIT